MLLHGPNGLRSRLYDAARLQGPSHITNEKHKTNTFDKSNKFLHLLFLVDLDCLKSFKMVSGCFKFF